MPTFSNVWRQQPEGKDYVVLPIGKKAVEYFKQKGVERLTEQFAEIAGVSVADCFEIAHLLCEEFKKGTFGHIELCYTVFKSMLSQQPEVFSVLPMTDIREESGGKTDTRNLILYEPGAEVVFDAIVPEYLAGLVYGAVCESTASELAARRMAMDAATSNAEEMIDTAESLLQQSTTGKHHAGNYGDCCRCRRALE